MSHVQGASGAAYGGVSWLSLGPHTYSELSCVGLWTEKMYVVRDEGYAQKTCQTSASRRVSIWTFFYSESNHSGDLSDDELVEVF